MNVTPVEPDEPVVDDAKAVLRRIRKERTEKAIQQVGLVLFALTALNKPVYRGTVTAKTKAKRRARGKVAKQSRKVNR